MMSTAIVSLLLQLCFALTIAQQAFAHQESTDKQMGEFDATFMNPRWPPFADEVLINKRFKRQASRYLEVKNISTQYFYGEPRIKSAFIECGQGENCTIKSIHSHTETARHGNSIGVKMEAGSILEICPSVSIDKIKSNATNVLYEFVVSGHSVARLMFKPQLAKISGVIKMKGRCLSRVARIFGGIATLGTSEIINSQLPECVEDNSLGFFEIIAPVSSHRGEQYNELDGDWFVEYADNPWPIDDEKFHNIRDRDLTAGPGDLKVATVANPIMCGQYANSYGFKVAVYKNATCHLKKTLRHPDMELITKNGDYLGEYTLELDSNINYNKTQTEKTKEHWIKHKMCDVIQYVKEFYHCINLSKLEKAVVMFKKESEKAQLDDIDIGPPIIN